MRKKLDTIRLIQLPKRSRKRDYSAVSLEGAVKRFSGRATSFDWMTAISVE